MPLYVFCCPNHGRVEVLLPTRQRPYYLCERCGQLCERGSTTVVTRVEGGAFFGGEAGLQPKQLSESAGED